MSNFSTHKSQTVVVPRQQMAGACQIKKPIHQELDKAPRQFNDYMNSINGRFSEICRIYLDGLSMDDIKYLSPDDLIAIVPDSQYNHKLLMTIMVRRYLYRTEVSVNVNECDKINTCQTIVHDPDSFVGDAFANNSDNISNTNDDDFDQISCDTSSSSTMKHPKKHKEKIYACNKCAHVCKNSKCKHSCDNYIKITQKVK